jgi:hypothetical protein
MFFTGCSANQLPCVVCGVPCELRCNQCKKVGYCSREHQLRHWKGDFSGHKVLCKMDITVFGHYISFSGLHEYTVLGDFTTVSEAELLKRLQTNRSLDLTAPMNMQKVHKSCRDLGDYYCIHKQHDQSLKYDQEALAAGRECFGNDHVLCASDQAMVEGKRPKNGV